MFRQPESQRT